MLLPVRPELFEEGSSGSCERVLLGAVGQRDALPCYLPGERHHGGSTVLSLDCSWREQVEARGGAWVFHRCQLRTCKVGGRMTVQGRGGLTRVDERSGGHCRRTVPPEQAGLGEGEEPILTPQRARMKILSCGIGGICTWDLQADNGILCYETSELLLAQSLIEWVCCPYPLPPVPSCVLVPCPFRPVLSCPVLSCPVLVFSYVCFFLHSIQSSSLCSSCSCLVAHAPFIKVYDDGQGVRLWDA